MRGGGSVGGLHTRSATDSGVIPSDLLALAAGDADVAGGDADVAAEDAGVAAGAEGVAAGAADVPAKAADVAASGAADDSSAMLSRAATPVTLSNFFLSLRSLLAILHLPHVIVSVLPTIAPFF